MKFTLSWLKDFLETNATLEEICAKLTVIGLEVEEVINRKEDLADFTVAIIIETKPHPNAEKLQICTVDSGEGMLQIVCGAPNARAGIKVVLAKIDTIIPINSMKIKPVAIRGVDSQGMLCSETELKIGDKEAGIIELPLDAKVGDLFIKYMGLDDPVIEISITPNRGDCLGVYGIARDLAATNIGKLKTLHEPIIKGEFACPIAVKIEDKDAILRFTGRYFKNVKNTQSPDWLKYRLINTGNSSISTLVDITNYISITFGRPLHVYDADKLPKNELVAKRAKKGEKFLALDDKTYTCKEGEVLITSNDEIHGFGGIIGGKLSAVTSETKNVFLESALFDPIEITNTGRAHQIDTSARYRFERNVDPLFVDKGQIIASSMIIDLCGGQVSESVDVGNNDFKNSKIIFPLSLVKTLGGVTLKKEKIIEILLSLGFEVKDLGENLDLTVPSWRNSDIIIKEDIVEEVIRINGYDQVDLAPLPNISPFACRILTYRQLAKTRVRRSLAKNGYFELLTWSFMNQKLAKYFGPVNEDLVLANPISSELDYMRPSIIPNLLTALKKNKARSFNSAALFEIGPVFDKVIANNDRIVVSGIKYGEDVAKNIHTRPRKVDIFDVKADIFDFINECGFNPANLRIDSKEVPVWAHPSKSSSIKIGNVLIGFMGEVHPKVLSGFDISDQVYAFEVDIDLLPEAKSKKGKKPLPTYSDFQVIERDFAFLVDSDVPSSQIVQSAYAADKKLIKNVTIFDLYKGDKIDKEKKSIAISVKIEPSDRTLTDKEIEEISQNIINNVNKNCGGVLRN